MSNWIDEIEELLIERLNPSKLIIEDKTHLHKNHPGHQAGKAHLKIQIHSNLFKDKSQVEQHRMVFELLKPHLKTAIHSISLVTNPSED
ncbi:MAG: hypothetical protein S4CHLAM7_12860 [Chlamydiae bacterium]|nr:hypothetical protein [Chlamydiota bacterium]